MLRHDDTALTLNRLDENTGGIFAKLAFYRLDIVQRHAVESKQQRPKPSTRRRIATRRDTAIGATMKPAIERNHPLAVRLAGLVMIAAHEFQPCLHCLRAARRKKYRIGEGMLHQSGCKNLQLLGYELVRAMPQGCALTHEGFEQVRVAVPEGIHRDTRREIKNPPSIVGD